MRIWEGGLRVIFVIMFGQLASMVDSKCCEKKTVPGQSSKAGTYLLVSNTEPVPDFCLGGCVYTKVDDSVPGTNYCFQDGEGNATCSGGGCGGGGGGGIEGWIEKYFEKQCSMQINSVLEVFISKQYVQTCGYNDNSNSLSNVTVAVFDNPTCAGEPVEERLFESTYPYPVFLAKVQKTEEWSVMASKTGYKSGCQTIGILVPFTKNYAYVMLEEDVEESETVPIASLDFTFDINNELLTDVFVQGNPQYCTNTTYGGFTRTVKHPFSKNINLKPKKRNKKPKKKSKKNKRKSKVNSDYDFFMKNPEKKNGKQSYGSGSGSGGGFGYNYKCYPTCLFTSWSTDPSLFGCNCKGVVGGGLNFSDMALPDQETPAGSASMAGSLYWYDDNTVNQDYYPPKNYLAFVEFTRRNSSDVRVCDSKLSITWKSANTPAEIIKAVPCFTKPVPATTLMPTYPTGGAPESPTFGVPTANPMTAETFPPPQGTDSPPGPGSGSSLPWPTSYPHWLTTVNYEDMFTEVEDVLIWGGGDRFWILGCTQQDSADNFITFDVDFFTLKDPKDTPEFCGCIVNTKMPGDTAPASKDLVRECYVKSITGGPSRRSAITGKSKLTKAIKKKFTNRKHKMKSHNGESEWLKNRDSIKRNKKALKNMKKMLKHKKIIGRSKRETFDENMLSENDFERELVEDEEATEDDDEEEDFEQIMFEEEMQFGDEMDFESHNEFDDYEGDEDDEDSLSSGWN